jgi:preprotein translocase subunit YajC
MIFATKAFADSTATPAITNAQTVAPSAPAAATPPQPSTLGMLLPFGLMFLVVYFLMIRPQQKKMKEHESMVGGLQKGEEVITQAGIFGKIHGISEKFITLEVDNNVRIKVLKNQIASVLRGDQKS